MKTNFSIVPKVALKNPITAYRLAMSFVKMYFAKYITYKRKDYKSNVLSLIYFRITPLCNLRCVMCGQRGDKGVLKGEFAREEAKTIVPLEVYKRLVDEIAHQKPTVYIWGGEPFMYPDLIPLMKYMVSAGLPTSLNTNGTYLERYAKEIVESGWHCIFVSLDAFEETNDKIRGKGSYKRVIAGFEAIKREKALQKKSFPVMSIVTCVSNLNYEQLADLARAAKDFDLGWHIYNLGTYSDDKIVAEQRAFMKEKFGVDATHIDAYNTGYNKEIDGEKLYHILNDIRAMDNGYPSITVPALNASKITEYYAHLHTFVRNKCAVPWNQVDIDYNGNVHFCADYPDWIVGNIKDEPLFKIFNNERSIKFRRELKNSEQGLFPGCKRCYQNMLFGRRIKGY